MSNIIIDYLINEEKMTEKVAAQMYRGFESYPDIMAEFTNWILNGKFPPDDNQPITIEGYTAEMLAQTTYLRPVGAYNYLMYLRKNPKEALENLKKGLPRK
jgi:hypothetical protein